MIRNVSYNRPEIQREINLKVGKEYHFMQRLRMGGNGSQRFIMKDSSEDLSLLHSRDNSTNYCSIELRKKGVIVRFVARLETFAWIIDYKELSFFAGSGSISIRAADQYATLMPANNRALDKKFISRLNTIQSEWVKNPD